MIGRVMSVVMLMGLGMTPLSLALAGLLAGRQRDGAVRRAGLLVS